MFKTEKRAAVIEDTGKAHFTVGPDSWCWLSGNELHWIGSRFVVRGPGQQWRKSFPLPDGVSSRDVRALAPGRSTVTLYTASHAFGLDADDGRWSLPVPLFVEDAR